MKVLIFTASAGNGHNSAARTISQKIAEDNHDSQIKIIDAYKEYTSKAKNWTMTKGYAFACNHMLSAYNYFFRQSEKSKPEKRDECGAHKGIFEMLDGLMTEIDEFKPDLIISTYIFVSVALADLKRTYDIPAKIFTLTLDYGISPYWECTTALDKMFVTGDYMKQKFLELGFKENQLVVSGIPIRTPFFKQYDKMEMRAKLDLDKNLFTIIVMKSGFFPINTSTLIKELNKIEGKAQIVFVNGRSETERQRVERLTNKKNFKHAVVNLGFVNNVDEYFSACDLVLGKAGGLSTTEAITKAIPSVIINKLPMQEIYNKDYLCDNGCALFVDKKHSISTNINELISNRQLFDNMVNNCKKTRNLNTLEIYSNEFNKVPKASYENFNYNKNKKNIIKDIKNTLKNHKF